MGKGDQQRYLKITKIEIIFADAWQHLVTTTFHLHFPYLTTRPAAYEETRLPHPSPCRGTKRPNLNVLGTYEMEFPDPYAAWRQSCKPGHGQTREHSANPITTLPPTRCANKLTQSHLNNALASLTPRKAMLLQRQILQRFKTC